MRRRFFTKGLTCSANALFFEQAFVLHIFMENVPIRGRGGFGRRNVGSMARPTTGKRHDEMRSD